MAGISTFISTTKKSWPEEETINVDEVQAKTPNKFLRQKGAPFSESRSSRGTSVGGRRFVPTTTDEHSRPPNDGDNEVDAFEFVEVAPHIVDTVGDSGRKKATIPLALRKANNRPFSFDDARQNKGNDERREASNKRGAGPSEDEPEAKRRVTDSRDSRPLSSKPTSSGHQPRNTLIVPANFAVKRAPIVPPTREPTESGRVTRVTPAAKAGEAMAKQNALHFPNLHDDRNSVLTDPKNLAALAKTPTISSAQTQLKILPLTSSKSKKKDEMTEDKDDPSDEESSDPHASRATDTKLAGKSAAKPPSKLAAKAPAKKKEEDSKPVPEKKAAVPILIQSDDESEPEPARPAERAQKKSEIMKTSSGAITKATRNVAAVMLGSTVYAPINGVTVRVSDELIDFKVRARSGAFKEIKVKFANARKNTSISQRMLLKEGEDWVLILTINDPDTKRTIKEALGDFASSREPLQDCIVFRGSGPAPTKQEFPMRFLYGVKEPPLRADNQPLWDRIMQATDAEMERENDKDREERHVQAAKKAGTNNVLIYPESGSGAVNLTTDDMEKLEPGEFLNDTVIDFYLKYIDATMVPSNCPVKYFFFNSFFFRRLSDLRGGSSRGRRGSNMNVDFSTVKKWVKQDVFAMDYVFIPINESSHWTVALVANPGNRGGKGVVIFIFDSLGHKGTSPANLIRKCLGSLAEARVAELMAADANDQAAVALREIDWETVPIRFPTVPAQDNYCDCGVFMLHYIEQFVGTVLEPFGGERLPEFISKRWFPHSEVTYKREYLKKLIYALGKKETPPNRPESHRVPEPPPPAPKQKKAAKAKEPKPTPNDVSLEVMNEEELEKHGRRKTAPELGDASSDNDHDDHDEQDGNDDLFREEPLNEGSHGSGQGERRWTATVNIGRPGDDSELNSGPASGNDVFDEAHAAPNHYVLANDFVVDDERGTAEPMEDADERAAVEEPAVEEDEDAVEAEAAAMEGVVTTSTAEEGLDLDQINDSQPAELPPLRPSKVPRTDWIKSPEKRDFVDVERVSTKSPLQDPDWKRGPQWEHFVAAERSATKRAIPIIDRTQESPELEREPSPGPRQGRSRKRPRSESDGRPEASAGASASEQPAAKRPSGPKVHVVINDDDADEEVPAKARATANGGGEGAEEDADDAVSPTL